MEVHSLGYRTDLIFHRYDGLVRDRGDYLVIKSPENPSFYWGNLLLFDRPPSAGDEKRWRSLFQEEVGQPPEVRHQVFGWDTTNGEVGQVQAFLKDGFRLARNVVMTTELPHPPARRSHGLNVRPLRTDGEWTAAIENQVICREPEFSEQDYRDFRQRQMARYRRMVQAGLGDWFGAFAGDRLVADLGVFTDGILGRYQSVQTHPDFRRQGIGGTLVFEAGRQSMAKYRLDVLVIVAEAGSKAANLYQSVGFQESEEQVGLELW